MLYSLQMGFDNGKLLRVTLKASSGSDLMINTLHYDLDDGDVIDTDNDPQTLADLFRDNVIPKWKALFEATWTIEPVLIVEEKDPLHPTDARSSWTSGASVVGTKVLTSDRLNFGMCPVATLRTANIGRRFRGRMFVGGTWSEDYHNGGGIIAGNDAGGGVKEIKDFLNAIPVQPDIALGSSGATANWCVYSRTQRAAGLNPYASHITSYTLRSRFHWLRRRALT